MRKTAPIHTIFWHKEYIGILTNQLNAQLHRHWMLQLFIGVEGSVELHVNEKTIHGACIVVEKNTPHVFSTKQLVFSLLIDPSSALARFLSLKMHADGYWIYDDEMRTLSQALSVLTQSSAITSYQTCINNLLMCLGFSSDLIRLDERISHVLHQLKNCICDDHTIEAFAKEAFLSTSRFSHLFKEEIGMPLKSYLLLHQMQCAFQALLEGASITDAAMSAGFASSSHFASTTKRMMGVSVSSAVKNSVFLKVL